AGRALLRAAAPPHSGAPHAAGRQAPAAHRAAAAAQPRRPRIPFHRFADLRAVRCRQRLGRLFARMNFVTSRPLPLLGTPSIELISPTSAAALDAARAIFRDYAQALDVDLGFQNFEDELRDL